MSSEILDRNDIQWLRSLETVDTKKITKLKKSNGNHFDAIANLIHSQCEILDKNKKTTTNLDN